MRKIPFAITLILAFILLFTVSPALASSSQTSLLALKNATPTKLKNGKTYHYKGTISSISSSNITVQVGSSSISFRFTSNTRFHVKGGKWSSFGSGDKVKVRAVYRNGAFVATDVTLSASKKKH